MHQLSVEERETLNKLLNDGYKFVARDEDGELYGFKKEPEKEDTIWYGGLLFCLLDFIIDSSFDFIKWEDNTPHEIEKLLEGENNENPWIENRSGVL